MSAKQLRCPKCSSVVTIPENVPGGNTLKCPRCTALFRTPTGQTSPPAKPALVKPAGAVPQPVVAIKPAGQAPKPQVANKSINPGSAKPSHQVPFTPQLLSVPPATNQRNPRSKQPNKKLPLIIGAGVGGGLLLSVLLVLLLNTGGNTPVVENKPNAPQNDTPQPKDNNAPRPNLMPVKNEGKIDLLGGVDPFTNQQPITGKPRLVLNPGGHVSVVKKVLFTPDGGKLITASLDKTVRVWNVATGETEKVFRMPIGPGHEGSINTIALSRDGKKLAVAGVPLGNGTLGDPIYLISLASGQVEKVLLGHKNNITGVDFSPDGKRLASCSMDNHCLIHEIETGRIIGNLNGHTSSLRRIYYSPDGQFLATASKDETVRIWDANTNQTVAILKSVAGPILSHFWSPDGNTLATGTAIGTIQLWTRTGQLIKNFPVTHPEKTLLISLRFAKDGNEILYTGIDDRGGKAGIFNLKTEQRRVTFPHHNNTVHDAHISPNGELAATTGGNDHAGGHYWGKRS